MMQFNRTRALTVGGQLLGLRVVFSIEKEMTAAGASKCEIKIYNLSKANQNAIEIGSKKQTLTLSAGYNGVNKLLYTGPIFYALTARVGPDIITTFQMLPGALALGTVFVKVSGAGTAYEVYSAVLNAFRPFGVVQGFFSAAVFRKLGSLQYASKYSDIGTASDLMDKITHWAGLRWNTTDNKLNVFSISEYQDAEVILLNKSTGMLGIPTKTQEGNYKVKALLNADIEPGKRVRVQSDLFPVNGDLRIIKVSHSGDSHPLDAGAEWFTEAEGTILGTEPGLVLSD